MVEKVYRIGLQRNFFALFSIPEMFIVMPFLETFSTFLKLFQPFYFWFRITHSLTKHVVAGKVGWSAYFGGTDEFMAYFSGGQAVIT